MRVVSLGKVQRVGQSCECRCQAVLGGCSGGSGMDRGKIGRQNAARTRTHKTDDVVFSKRPERGLKASVLQQQVLPLHAVALLFS